MTAAPVEAEAVENAHPCHPRTKSIYGIDVASALPDELDEQHEALDVFVAAPDLLGGGALFRHN